jgi:hypothetical protein
MVKLLFGAIAKEDSFKVARANCEGATWRPAFKNF